MRFFWFFMYMITLFVELERKILGEQNFAQTEYI